MAVELLDIKKSNSTPSKPDNIGVRGHLLKCWIIYGEKIIREVREDARRLYRLMREVYARVRVRVRARTRTREEFGTKEQP